MCQCAREFDSVSCGDGFWQIFTYISYTYLETQKECSSWHLTAADVLIFVFNFIFVLFLSSQVTVMHLRS